MVFLAHDINSLLDGVSEHGRDADLEDALNDLAPRLEAGRRDHRHFGPYWWWFKPLLRSAPGARRSWVRGGFRDRSILEACLDPASLLPPDHGGTEREQQRWLAWIGLQYFRSEIVDDRPAGFHIVELADRSVVSYQVYDGDASRQMDLFDTPSTISPEVEQLFRDPSSFSGSAWLRRADQLEQTGRPWAAAAALRRAISNAVDADDRSRAWLRLGQLFQEQHHVRKAIFCYRNAFERDQEAWIQGLMGEAWQQAGEPHEALRCYRAALESMPGNPEYQAGVVRAEQEIKRHRDRVAGYTLLPEPLAR